MSHDLAVSGRPATDSVYANDYSWLGAFNARDLGGIEVASGVIRPGVLFRSGKPEAWEPEGFHQAASSGVRRIVDLRDPSEPGGAPAGASSAGIDYGFTPVEDPHSPRFRARFQPYMNHTSGYADFLDMFGDRVAAAVGDVFSGSPGALLCCSAGRDRTGIVVSVILLALGADHEELARQDELAVRAVNERHRGRIHPYESWQPAEIVDDMVASRRASLLDFAASLDAKGFLERYGVGRAKLDAGREWLIDA